MLSCQFYRVKEKETRREEEIREKIEERGERS
jgi:hypothetical protein